MDRWRKFAVLVVLTLVTTALPGSRCSAQIRKAGFGDSFGSGTPRRDEDSSLFLRHGEWSARMRRDLEDKCDSSLFKESEMLELPATIGPTDRADVNSLKELYIRLNLRIQHPANNEPVQVSIIWLVMDLSFWRFNSSLRHLFMEAGVFEESPVRHVLKELAS
ncbi:hypothetical protein LSH36_64g05015 [Paralvinella palmiformis]|uniref:Uncharacterized protein n=1 Tax=Paralvinella palmiformis TaxID=53620 RepID=A0AAD9K4G8_9ANNE|nr:hypothetical protein LSH36_64g05015 [Paralvinella palmiformis]